MLKLSVQSQERTQFLDVTGQIERMLHQSGIYEGICCLFVPHTTAAITINEHADPNVMQDMQMKLTALIPQQGAYRHREGNSDAHIKASLYGSSVTLPVSRGRLQLGTWQGIFFCEFDGPRQRQVYITFVGKESDGVMKVW